MVAVSKKLLQQSKEAISANVDENGQGGKDTLRGRDLLTLLTRAYMATDVSQSQRLFDPDADVLARRFHSLLVTQLSHWRLRQRSQRSWLLDMIQPGQSEYHCRPMDGAHNFLL